MQSLSNKESDSVATLFSNRVTMLCSDKPPQVSLSESVAAELETSAEHCYRAKLAKSQYQEHDSSSTLPSGQSHTLNASFQPGSTEPVELSLHGGNSDYSSHQVQVEHNQSLDWMSLAAPCFGRITAAYQPNAVVMYPQMMGIVPPRVVLPLDCTQGIPIYVNAKQYHAIIRRRQTRAKLEAQNKAAKSRKPYIHESRHRHALTRARGSGGRFLNTKKGQQSKPATQTSRKNRVQHSESNSWRTSSTSGPDSSCNDDIFQPPDFRVTNSLTIGGSRSRVVAPGDMLLLSIDKCARISTES